ncbi:hypothetical protein ABK040_012284 [Willaertia magna]
MLSSISQFFQSSHLLVKNDWLEQCIQFIQSEELAPQQRNNLQALREGVYNQYLFSDLSVITPQPTKHAKLFQSLDQYHSKIIKGPFVLQINDIRDIGKPLVEQIDMGKEYLVTQNEEEIEEGDLLFSSAMSETLNNNNKGGNKFNNKNNNNEESSFSYSKRLLHFTLSDGYVNNIQAMEYKPINSLSLNTPLGTKILIKEVLVRRSLLLLVPECIQVLGGGVDELIEKKVQWKKEMAEKRSGKLELRRKIDQEIDKKKIVLKSANANNNNNNFGKQGNNQTNIDEDLNDFNEEELLMLEEEEDDSNIIEASDDEEETTYNKKLKK